MNAPPAPDWAQEQARFCAATLQDLDAIIELEQSAYALPWSRMSFADLISHQGSACGDYVVQLLWSQQHPGMDVLQGYFVALIGADEVHLLNMAVHPFFQGQGHAPLLLCHLRNWAQWLRAQHVWLEVRQSNPRALGVYQRFGFKTVAVRKNYYPTPNGGRENATVMCLHLQAVGEGGSVEQA